MSGFDISRFHFSALIFDCDGTLMDSAPLHFRAQQKAFASQGLPFDEEWYRDHLGLSRVPLYDAYERDYGRKIDYDAAGTLSESVFAAIVHEVRESPFAASIAREHQGKVPMAVASGGHHILVEKALKAIGLFELFDAVVAIEDVAHGKPAPDLFLEAARRLGVSPEECLVFEDTDEGLEAAHRANMQAVDVRPFE